MLLSTLLLVASGATSMATAILAAPASSLDRRACTVIFPDIAISFSSSTPTINTPGIALARAGPGYNTKNAGITFSNIPAGATGCSLHYALPAVPSSNPNQYATGANNFDVFGVATPISRTTTWSNQPRTTTKWASVDVPEYASQRYETILLATTCDQAKSFLFQMSDWQQNAGTIQIPQNPTASGFWLTYNC